MRILFPLTSLLFFTFPGAAGAQVHSKTGTVGTAAAEHAASLAETGHCSEAPPLLTRTAAHITDRELQKRVSASTEFAARRYCSTGAVLDKLRVLNQHFGHDPEVLYLTVHAYSDLSSDAARELALTAPTSIPALEMDAEANERLGKSDDAEKNYRKIASQNPRYAGIHFRLAQLLLSRPNPGSDFQAEAWHHAQRFIWRSREKCTGFRTAVAAGRDGFDLSRSMCCRPDHDTSHN